MSVKHSGDILTDVEASLRTAWDVDDSGFKDADWKALYFDAIAAPCFERGYSVACTLTKRRDHRPWIAKTPAFDKYQNMFAPKEQALDLLAVDSAQLKPVLGAEIEWSANRKHRIPENEEVVTKLWGEQIRKDGCLDEILYDLGRLLAFNPPKMVLVTQPSRRVGFQPVFDEVQAMYSRMSSDRGKGDLLLMVEEETEPIFRRLPH